MPEVGKCYITHFAEQLGPNSSFYEIDKVIAIHVGSEDLVEFVYTFPKDPHYDHKWATIDSKEEGMVRESLERFNDLYKEVPCPW
jgi:hypothetical protein